MDEGQVITLVQVELEKFHEELTHQLDDLEERIQALEGEVPSQGDIDDIRCDITQLEDRIDEMC